MTALMGRYRRVEAYSSSGLPYAYWTRDLPPIPSDLLDSVVYLYPGERSAEIGESFGGSGFLASVPLGWDAHALYIATNRHVAEKATHARLTRHDGGSEIIEVPKGGWHFHPDGDDVAAFPLELPGARFASISRNHFARKDYHGLLPGDDAFFLGRFVSVEGKQQNAPLVRFGHLAMAETQKIPTPRGFDQESFLVEALSLSGYSGSPVMVFRMHLEAHWGGSVTFEIGRPSAPASFQVGKPGRPELLGIDWGHIHTQAKVRSPGGELVSEKFYVEQNTGVAGVVPAWKLSELFDIEELTEMRDKRKKEVEKAAKNVTLDSAEEEDSEFDQFEELTRKVVSVPKEEIDKKRADEKKKR